MRLPDSAHTERPWRIHELTPDFELLDVWAAPTPGGPDDFGRFVDLFMSYDPAQSSSFAVRTLFAVRWVLGDLLGLDAPDTGVGGRVPSLRDRMSADLREAGTGPSIDALPFQWLYVLDDECAAEVANKTVHGVLHAGWVPDGDGGYRGQVAVLVRPNGLLGRAYLAFIKPFRHALVYPAIFKELERRWAGAGDNDAAHLRSGDDSRPHAPSNVTRTSGSGG
jgi:Protein of unknown function (DUF2867)